MSVFVWGLSHGLLVTRPITNSYSRRTTLHVRYCSRRSASRCRRSQPAAFCEPLPLHSLETSACTLNGHDCCAEHDAPPLYSLESSANNFGLQTDSLGFR
jgi:hypothetical protein